MFTSRWLSIYVLLGLGVGLVLGSPVVPMNPLQKEILPPYSSKTLEVTVKGGQPSTAICIGDGRSYLGLYVLDRHGNCVAWEDINVSKTRDDLAVEWYAPEKATYTIEVVNFGSVSNQFDVAVK
jgi:hypothetical protein